MISWNLEQMVDGISTFPAEFSAVLSIMYDHVYVQHKSYIAGTDHSRVLEYEQNSTDKMTTTDILHRVSPTMVRKKTQ